METNSHNSENPEAQCVVCRRTFTLGTGINDGFEAIFICRECKRLVVDDNDASPVIRSTRRRRRHRGRGSRYGSSESIEDLFSQQFSQLIGLVRQNHDVQAEDGDATVTPPPRGSSSSGRIPLRGDATVTPPPRGSSSSGRIPSRGWWRPLSDYDSESIDHGESLFGETDSNISFFGGDSEASQREISTHPDYESHNYTDTDIDPMHAGLDQWNSDEDWEGFNMEEAAVILAGPHVQMQDAVGSPSGSISSAQNGRWIRWRVHHADLFADFEEFDIPPLVGNSGDYVDARGFEELLEQLTEADGSRRGAPPAAGAVIRSLPRVIIAKCHEKDGNVVCAVCKDPMPIDSEAKQLPCSHMYHPSCILPWLSARNSCPVCRYELPTDDLDYEQEKQNAGGVEIHIEELSSDALRGERVEEREPERVEEHERAANANTPNGRWILLAASAAAPIVGIVGVALALWFQKSVGDARINVGNGDRHGPQQRQRSSDAAGGSRRWWLPF